MERIQKVLARIGIASRRQIEAWIKAGRVEMDGAIAKLGDKASANSKIKIDNRLITLPSITTEKTRVIAYYKPIGEICSRKDPEQRKTVFDALPSLKQGRWINIGRLDINTSGLLLFTNDGDLAHRLMHPSSHIEREYAVRVYGKIDPKILERLQKGVKLEDGIAKFESIIDAGGTGSNHWYHVIVNQGRNRIVRRLWESQGIEVSRLIRIRFGTITLDKKLKPGKYQELKNQQNTLFG